MDSVNATIFGRIATLIPLVFLGYDAQRLCM